MVEADLNNPRDAIAGMLWDGVPGFEGMSKQEIQEEWDSFVSEMSEDEVQEMIDRNEQYIIGHE